MSLHTRLDVLESNNFSYGLDIILPFYCKNETCNNSCFTHLVGLPNHPAEFEPMNLMPYQIELAEQIISSKHTKFHINKSRQIGVTEIMLRIIQYLCFDRYSGGKVMIIAGTREKTTKKIMARFKQLFYNLQEQIKDSNDLVLELKNGTIIEGLPSSSDAIRGDTKIKAVLVDEAAHFKLTDDSVIMDAIRPIVTTNKSDLFLVSTPNGPRGFFYDISHSDNDYHKIELPYTNAIGCIYTEDEIKKELASSDLDVDQEYKCKFTSARNSIFGSITDDMTDDYEAEEY